MIIVLYVWRAKCKVRFYESQMARQASGALGISDAYRQIFETLAGDVAGQIYRQRHAHIRTLGGIPKKITMRV